MVFRTSDGREITQDELFEGFTSHGIYDKVFGNADDGDSVSGETESAEESEEESGEEADLSFLP